MTRCIARAEERSLPVWMCRYFRRAQSGCRRPSAGGEHGRRLGKDPSGRGARFFRRRLPGGLAGQQNEEKVPGLEEKTAAGETMGDAEEAGFVLMGP